MTWNNNFSITSIQGYQNNFSCLQKWKTANQIQTTIEAYVTVQFFATGSMSEGDYSTFFFQYMPVRNQMLIPLNSVVSPVFTLLGLSRQYKSKSYWLMNSFELIRLCSSFKNGLKIKD